jgi:Fe-S-cluster containining protein
VGDDDLPAGRFSTWLGEIQGAIRGDRGSDVPCGGCTACCTASQFIHIGPDETATLAAIPAGLAFPAPGLPRGHVLLGYDQHGDCPMLVDNACSIYADRPRTCRTYDCRVFPATGIDAAEDGKGRIAERARRWRFDTPTDTDRTQQGAVRAAADFLAEHVDDLPPGTRPPTATARAVLALEIHDVFLRHEGGDPTPLVELVQQVLGSGDVAAW